MKTTTREARPLKLLTGGADASGDMTERIVVRALVRARCGSYVLLRRAQDDRFGGRWELPGGSVEPGEAPAAAVARELHEEAGLVTTTSPSLVASARRQSPRGRVLREHAFRVEADGVPTLSSEHDAIHLWQPGTEMPGLLTESAAELLALATAA
jgi:8-oxo-dGTP diphosphatase